MKCEMKLAVTNALFLGNCCLNVMSTQYYFRKSGGEATTAHRSSGGDTFSTANHPPPPPPSPNSILFRLDSTGWSLSIDGRPI